VACSWRPPERRQSGRCFCCLLPPTSSAVADYVGRRPKRSEGGHGTNFIAYWRGHGTIVIGAANLSPVTKLLAGTGAVSGYKLSRSQRTVTMQDLYCRQVRVSGYKIQQGLSEEQDSANTMTSLLTLPSVLGAGAFYYSCRL
jgi:hypothetical protein